MNRGLLSIVLVTLATATMAASISTLIAGNRWIIESIVVAIVIAVVGWFTSVMRGGPHMVFLAQSLMAGIAIGLFTVMSSGTFNIPAVMQTGLQDISTSPPPAPETPGITLLVVSALTVILLLVDLVTIGYGQSATAAFPLLAGYSVVGLLSPTGLSAEWFALAVAGFALLFFVDSADLLQSWGMPIERKPDRLRLVPAALMTTALMTLTGIVVAAAIPNLGGGNQAAGLAGGGLTVNNPMFDLRKNLSQRPDLDAFSYRTTANVPPPVRIATVDSYNGETFLAPDAELDKEQTATGGLPTPPGMADKDRWPVLDTKVTIDSLSGSAYLPAPYPAIKFEGIDDSWVYTDKSLNVVGRRAQTESGMTYSVQHYDVRPSSAELASADNPPAAVVAEWTQLPQNTPSVVKKRAQEVAGEGTVFQQATRLQEWFRTTGDFVYSEEVTTDTGSLTAIETFLKDRRGYCVHFASTMAVMARTLGIPSRVAVGFLPGTQNTDGSWSVEVRDAHAWPEIYFEGYGWIRFEPTPDDRAGPPPEWTDAQQGNQPVEEEAPQVEPEPTVEPEPEPTEELEPGAADDQGSTETEEATATEDGSSPWVKYVMWVFIALGVILAAVAGWFGPQWLRERRRERAWASARTGAERADLAWDSLRDAIVDVGAKWSDADTPRAVYRHISTLIPVHAHDPLSRIIEAVEKTRYANIPLEDNGGRLQRDVHQVVSELTGAADGSRHTPSARS